MNINFGIKRAVVAFSVAAFTPLVISAVIGNISSDWKSNLILCLIFYFVYFLIVMAIGFPTLLVSKKTKTGSILIPPLVGAAFGFVVSRISYSHATTASDQFLPVMIGSLTAVVAALAYFRPWSRRT